MVSWTDLLGARIPEKQNKLRYSQGGSLAPRIVVWNITARCNLRCWHCYYSSGDRSSLKELKLEEARNFVADLSALKVHTLLFSGGEPLLKPDIFALAKFAKDKGIKVALSTNGTLINSRVAREIKKAGFSYVGISLDGMEETNDIFRQEKGAFQRSLQGIRNCKKLGLAVGLRFTLTRYNFKDLPDIFSLAERERVDRFCIYHLAYVGRGSNIREMDLSHLEKRRALELIWRKTNYFLKKKLNIEVLTVNNHADGAWAYIKLKELYPARANLAWEMLKAQGGNSAGIKIASVDDCGNIYADQFLRRYPLGNIRIKKFSQTWLGPDNSLLEALRDRISYLPERCQRCSFIKICNGNFRARAEAISGNLWQDDPACYLTEEEIHQGAKVYSPPDCVGVNA
ncbi:MAG: radical SAM protein [Candidatus Omnitrophota bacterium]|nr:radical SAM protein [Candidatus Omnitrophota bacterium]